MPNGNEIVTGKKTAGQFTIQYQQDGYGGVIPIIDGTPQPTLMFGYVSETDKTACMELIEKAIRATNGNIYEAKHYIMNAVTMAAREIKADEAVMVKGWEVVISYENRKAYRETEEIANLDDLTCELPNEAIKALLIDRAKLFFEREIMEYDPYAEDDYGYGDYDEDDTESETETEDNRLEDDGK